MDYCKGQELPVEFPLVSPLQIEYNSVFINTKIKTQALDFLKCLTGSTCADFRGAQQAYLASVFKTDVCRPHSKNKKEAKDLLRESGCAIWCFVFGFLFT